MPTHRRRDTAGHGTADGRRGERHEQNDTSIKPTLQLIDVKKIQPANPHAMASDRYRLVISDGQQLMQAMLATNLNTMMDTGQARGAQHPRRRRRIGPQPSPPAHPQVAPGASTPTIQDT